MPNDGAKEPTQSSEHVAIARRAGVVGLGTLASRVLGAVRDAVVAAFFAIVAVGSVALTLRLDMDSAIGGVLTGVLVLFVLLSQGLRATWARRHDRRPAIAAPGLQPDATTVEVEED